MDDPIAELKQLQETDGIVDYYGRFELIRTRVDLPKKYMVSAYLVGLRTHTQMHIRMFQPQSIRECVMLGQLYEKAHPKKHVMQSWSAPRPNIHKGVLPMKKGPNTVETLQGQQNKQMNHRYKAANSCLKNS